MSIVPHKDADANAFALTTTSNLSQTPEEIEKRWKEAQELEEKLNFIQEHVPTRIQNVCGSSAGAGSGDFHQYRMIRRHEQMRLKRVDEEWEKKKEQDEFSKKRQQREQEAAERTAKRRAKRQKKKVKKQSAGPNDNTTERQGEGSAESSGEDDQPVQPGLD